MAINTLAFATELTKQLDQATVQQCKTGFMENNLQGISFVGTKNVKIPHMETQGLGNYDRDNGFVTGSVTTTEDIYTLTQDRGRQFQLDRQDVDETNYIATIANLAKVFQEEHVIPEIDAYRMSKIAQAGKPDLVVQTTSTVATTGIKDAIRSDIVKIRRQGFNGKLVMMCSWDVKEALEAAISAQLRTTTLTAGSVNEDVYAYNDVTIVPMPDNCLYTKLKLNDGKTSGQKEGGYTADSTSANIDYLIFPMSLPLGVSKQDNARIFTPEQNQKLDAWQYDYRKYHDLFIKSHQKSLIVGRTWKSSS